MINDRLKDSISLITTLSPKPMVTHPATVAAFGFLVELFTVLVDNDAAQVGSA